MLNKVKKFPLIKEDRLENIIDYADEINNLVATIVLLKGDEHLHNPILLQELVNKLLTSYKVQWAEHMSDEKSSVKLLEFKSWITSKSDAVSKVQFPKWIENKKKSFEVKTSA